MKLLLKKWCLNKFVKQVGVAACLLVFNFNLNAQVNLIPNPSLKIQQA
jgi:hypothetical protein